MSWQDDASRDLVRSFGDRMAMFVRGEGPICGMPTGAATSISSRVSR